ncbi:CocE/NonD family hydrolase [Kutzneria sp. NPDC051319]|uniref:CocE/NonD family hydrolase n=1 Tax=Kutzneria sp. NPDC051319 TaxID=3155047 RepID=UPI003434B087
MLDSLGTRIVGGIHRRAFGLPPRRNAYTVERGLLVPVRDGAQLVTDHYAPVGPANGTVLIRSPYGRGLPESLLHGRMLAERGYHVVIQSVRGTGGSTGPFRPIAQETADAQDAVAWLRTQSWFTGTLATLGGSYLGWTQWALLQDPPAELRAAVVIVGPHDFSRAIHGSGGLALADFLGWSAAIEAPGPVAMMAARRRVAAALRESTPAKAAAAALGTGDAPWFADWLDHDNLDDPYWQPYNAGSALRDGKVPVLLIGGWHDVFIDQTLEQYRSLSKVALTVGPWTHLDTAAKASKVADTEALAWFDQHLAGIGPAREAPVRIHVTGAGQWRSMPWWPPVTRDLVLALDASARLTDSATGGGIVEFSYDPVDPTPAVGGRHMSTGAGRKDNRRLEARDDVVVFTSDPLEHDLEVLGPPRLRLAVDGAPVFVRLCDVDRRGRSWNVTESFGSATEFELGSCAHRFRAGHRLRLQVSGGAYPRYARNTKEIRYTIDCAGSALTVPVAVTPSPE